MASLGFADPPKHHHHFNHNCYNHFNIHHLSSRFITCSLWRRHPVQSLAGQGPGPAGDPLHRREAELGVAGQVEAGDEALAQSVMIIINIIIIITIISLFF